MSFCTIILQETLLLSRLWTSMLLQTPWFSAYLRLLGAKVGEKVSFDEDLGIHEPWLVEIGEGTQLGVARISPHSLEPLAVFGSASVSVKSQLLTESFHHSSHWPPTISKGKSLRLHRPFVAEPLKFLLTDPHTYHIYIYIYIYI